MPGSPFTPAMAQVLHQAPGLQFALALYGSAGQWWANPNCAPLACDTTRRSLYFGPNLHRQLNVSNPQSTPEHLATSQAITTPVCHGLAEGRFILAKPSSARAKQGKRPVSKNIKKWPVVHTTPAQVAINFAAKEASSALH